MECCAGGSELEREEKVRKYIRSHSQKPSGQPIGRRLALISSTLIMAGLVGAGISALPRLSAEHAVACKQCHINPNGGGARNEFGNHAVAFQELCIPPTKKLLASHYSSPRLSPSLLVGFDSRWLLLDDPRIIRMQSDLYVTLSPFKHFDYHFRIGPVGSGAMQVTEQYALFSFCDTRYWVKAGTFYPAFGLRQDDHNSYTRVKTGHPYNSYLDGISFGAEWKDVSLTAETFNQDGRTMFALHGFRTGYVSPIGYLLGASYQHPEKINGSTGAYPRAKAMFGAVNWDRITISGEYDLIGNGNDSAAFYAAATARIIWGLYLTGEYNYFDPSRRYTSGFERFTRISVDFYPVPYVKIRPSISHYKPAVLGQSDDFFVQFHVGY